MRYFKATLEYDGTDFAGFQWQHGTRTVQGVLEAAITVRTGQAVRLTGAGRTDAGVHALGQVISFGIETRIPLDRMALALNSALPPDVTIWRVEEVTEAFSARFSASSRVYAYLILNRSLPSALWRRYSAFCSEPLDVEAMQEGARQLLGEQDFAAFTNELQADEPTFRDVMRCQVRRIRNFVLVRIEANAFLRGMVRTIVGTLLEVGQGRRAPGDIPALLATRDRKMAGPSAPAQGLCLLRVHYGERKQYGRLRIAAEGAARD
ncbi:MAG TPA: tRNA pseudouridine(38-40) synthase TruA [Chthonomonadaceae bacterium]|nr:tRNA pseudouridine(38-40) synthase TruA [Chthonomonadaceae bacterium]